MISANSIDQLEKNTEPVTKEVFAFVDQRAAIGAEHRAPTNAHRAAVGFFDGRLLTLDQIKPVSGYVDCSPGALVHISAPQSPNGINEKSSRFASFGGDVVV